MPPKEKRTRVIQACIAHQQHVAAVAKTEMESAQQQSNDYGANVDRYDSYRTKMMRARDMYAKQYAIANSSLQYLNEALRHPPYESAEHGAIVITDKQRFFLSVGVGKFVVADDESPTGMQYYFAISAQTPIYLALKGKHIGDSLLVNGISHKIIEIF